MNDPPPPVVSRIVSGGQTGADRAALDVALELGIPHGGWCPRGRLAEDGPLDPRYQLRETRSPKYHMRTRRNVLDSDGTLLVVFGVPVGGTELTLRYAQRRHKPYYLAQLPDADPAAIRAWLATWRIGVLNVAGPRESTAPGIYLATRALLHAVLAPPRVD